MNYKLALWNPEVNGIRYLKALTYNLAVQLSPGNLARIRRIANRDVGTPISARVAGEVICMDYLQAVYELDFIGANLDLDGRSVLTPQQFAKVRFVPPGEQELLDGATFDLCMNIDSFAEMGTATVHGYLELIAKHCRYLYVKNPVGKYMDKSLDGHHEGSTVVQLALSTGLLTEVLDSGQVATMAARFTQVYRPADGWRCVSNSWAVPWSYYRQALYHNEGAG